MNVQDILAQLGGVDGLKDLGAKVGLNPDDALKAAQGLLENAQAGDPQAVAQAAAEKTGLDLGAISGMLPGLMGMMGGAGGLAEQFSKQLTQGPLGGLVSMIDKDKDGNVVEDIIDLAGGLFGKKPS
jgi:hypothetical protein